MSAVIAADRQVVWAKDFGYADVENRVPMDPTTPSHLASLTKPFVSVIITQLVEAGMLDLQEPISNFGIDLQETKLSDTAYCVLHFLDSPKFRILI